MRELIGPMPHSLQTTQIPATLRLVVLVSLAAAAALNAEDWLQFRGPSGDGTSGERIQKNWQAQPPRQVWKKTLGSGFSSFAVSQGRAFTMVKRTIAGVNREVCVALNAETGAELWATALGPAQYDIGADDGTSSNRGGDGPRSTPTVRGDRVYTSDAYLVMQCLNATNGQVLWTKDLPALYSGSVIAWQNAASPVIDGDYIFVNGNAPTQRLMALRAADGSLAWRVQDDKMTQATPVAATILGVRQIVFFTQKGLVSVAPTNGAVLWRYTFPYTTSTGASPVVAGDIVYCSAGYGIGAGAVRITKSASTWKATEIWRTPGELINQWSTPVHHNGFVYGLYGHGQYGTAPLKCVRLATGEEMWSEDGFGPGGVLLVDGVLLVLKDTGQLVLVQPDPTAYTELGRYQALSGKCWNVPAISNGRIYARSTKEIVSLDVSVQPPPPLRLSLARGDAGGPWQLHVACSDGSAVDASRAAALEVRTATSLATPLASWTIVAGALELIDGTLRLAQPVEAGTRARYFIVLDKR